MRTGVAALALSSFLPGCLAAPGQGTDEDDDDAGASARDASSSRGDGGDAEPLPGLIAWYPFDEGTADGPFADQAGGHDASCSACPTVVDGRGGGEALEFDSGPYLEVAPASVFDSRAGTVTGWVMVDGEPPADGATVVSRPYGGATLNSWEVFFYPGSEICVASIDLIECTAADLGSWIQFALTWTEDGTRTLYVDGVAVISRAGDPITFDDSPMLIGADRDGADIVTPLEGSLDDLRLYDRALSPGEVVTSSGRDGS